MKAFEIFPTKTFGLGGVPFADRCAEVAQRQLVFPLGEDAFDYCVSWVYGPNVYVTVGPLPLWEDSDGTSYCNGISNTTTGFVVTEYADGHVAPVQFGELIRLKTTPEGESVFYHLRPTESL